MNANQPLKRRNDSIEDVYGKRLHTSSVQDQTMADPHPTHPTVMPPRPKTPPLGMTLSHYNPQTGSYVASQLISNHEVKETICTGMTSVYRAPIERYGSFII
ncbi:hypothetical protein RMATCC62417_11687 [Rhizopus microsporus]|nr:hypothetical protein RMATCC62417_11687 [Rhizopus microsporus]